MLLSRQKLSRLAHRAAAVVSPYTKSCHDTYRPHRQNLSDPLHPGDHVHVAVAAGLSNRVKSRSTSAPNFAIQNAPRVARCPATWQHKRPKMTKTCRVSVASKVINIPCCQNHLFILRRQQRNHLGDQAVGLETSVKVSENMDENSLNV